MAPVTMLSIVSHMSVYVCGGYLPVKDSTRKVSLVLNPEVKNDQLRTVSDTKHVRQRFEQRHSVLFGPVGVLHVPKYPS